MGIEQKTPNASIDDMIGRKMQYVEKVIVRNLAFVGEKAVNAARSLPSPPQSLYWDSEAGEPKRNIPPHKDEGYIDWTANLRSSIGYIIVKHGEVVMMSDFQQVKNTASEGTEAGKRLAEKLAEKHHKGFVLIIVAGMNYAYYVQKKGYDVIASAELLAEKLVTDLIHAKHRIKDNWTEES